MAEIAARAGLTKRTFFRYFADKREVLFSGAAAFQERVVAAVISAPEDVAPSMPWSPPSRPGEPESPSSEKEPGNASVSSTLRAICRNER